MRNSLQYSQSETDNLKDTVKSQGEQLLTVSRNNSDISELNDRIRILDDSSHRNNLRFDGVTEQSNENYEQTQSKIKFILAEKLNINVKLESANRVGNNNNNNRKPRPVL